MVCARHLRLLTVRSIKTRPTQHIAFDVQLARSVRRALQRQSPVHQARSSRSQASLPSIVAAVAHQASGSAPASNARVLPTSGKLDCDKTRSSFAHSVACALARSVPLARPFRALKTPTIPSQAENPRTRRRVLHVLSMPLLEWRAPQGWPLLTQLPSHSAAAAPATSNTKTPHTMDRTFNVGAVQTSGVTATRSRQAS